MSENLFSLCHYGLFCVEFWDWNWIQSIVEYVCNVIKRGEGERGVQTFRLDCISLDFFYDFSFQPVSVFTSPKSLSSYVSSTDLFLFTGIKLETPALDSSV